MQTSESLPRSVQSQVSVALALAAWLIAGASIARAQGELLPPPPTLGDAPQEEVMPTDNVVEIRILGNETVPTAQIDDQISTRVGRPFDRSIVQKDVRQLANLGWFVDVKPLYETTPQGRIVIFKVVERPTIRYVTYLGNEKITDKNLGKQTNIKPGGAIDPYSVEEGRRKITEYYQGKGYNNVQVTILEGTKPTDKGIVYLINEGNFEKVWDVEFIGNEFVSDGRLKTIIKSKPPKFLYLKGYVNREEIDADVDRLTAYYRSFGYFQARVSRKIDYYPGKKWIQLTYVIHEGARYKIRNVRFMGNSTFEPSAIAEAAKLKAGEPFEQSKVRQDQKWIQELYGSHGYVFADIRPETVFLEEPGEVDLIYHINEGERFRIGNIIVNIEGDNPHTRRQTVINRLSMYPGEIADIREIHASQRRVQSSNLFHVDAAANVRPKIDYRISEDDAEYNIANRPPKRRRRTPPPAANPQQGSGSRGFGGRAGGAGFRGQSPDDLGPPVLPPPKQQQPTDAPAVIRGQSPAQPQFVQPSWARRMRAAQTTQTAHKPVDPYRHLRGQSPGPTVQNAYSTLPAGGVPQPQYGGQIVSPTGPTSKQIVANNGVQPVQFTENIPPPAASFGAPQGLLANPVPGYQLFPDGRFGLPGQPYPEQTIDVIFNGQETQTGRLMFGVGVNSDAGLVGNIVLDERNFDWRRWPRNGFEDFRNGTAFRGAGQRFRIDASPGSEVNRYLMSFQEPYLFDTPITLGLSGSFFDRRFRDWDEERLGGRISLGRQWVENDISANISYRGENVTITDAPAGLEIPGIPEQPFVPAVPDDPMTPVDESMPEIPFRPAVPPVPANADLAEALGTNALHGFKVTVINDTRDSAFLATQGRYLQMSGEYVTGTFEYPRVEIDFRRFFLLSERPDHSGRHVLSFSTNVGWLGDDAPIYEHFFAGGFSTMRGFDFRGASPVDPVRGVEVGGHFQWLNSLQYLFPVTADEMLHGVVFCDFGTVESDVEINDFRVVPGVGLRITVPALGPAPIALDFGWALNENEFDDTEVFSFSMGFGRN